MSTIASVDRALVRSSHLVNGRAQVMIESARSYKFQSSCQAFKGGLDKPTSIGINVANTKRFIQTTMVTSMEREYLRDLSCNARLILRAQSTDCISVGELLMVSRQN